MRVYTHSVWRTTNALPDKGMAPNYDDIINAPITKVTNIEPSTFVEALISILSSQGGTAIFDLVEQGIDALPNDDTKLKLRQQLRDLKSFSDTDTSQLRDTIMQLPDGDQRNLLSYALESAEDSLGRLSVKSGQMIPLLEGINKISDKIFQDALKTILTTAQSLEDARNKLECWFNDGMSRTSNLYKNKIAYVSFAIGLIIAALLNVDTLLLAKTLWTDPTLRDSSHSRQNCCRTKHTRHCHSHPIHSRHVYNHHSSVTDATPVPATPTPDVQAATVQSAEDVQKTLNDLLSLNLPIGWTYVNVNDQLKQDCIKTAGTATLSDADLDSCVQNTIQSDIDSGLGDPRDNSRNFWTLLPGSNVGLAISCGKSSVCSSPPLLLLKVRPSGLICSAA